MSVTETGEARLRGEIVRIARAMDEAGFAPSKSGNVSCRLLDRMLVTPTGLPYAGMVPADVVELDLASGDVVGEGRPSSEWPFHQAIYLDRPEVGAIVHTHSPRATALSCARRAIPPFHYMIAMAGGSDIPCADYATFGSQALAGNAVRALRGRKAVLLANHGVVAVGRTLAGAFALAAEVENLAGAYLALLAAGLEPHLLSEAEMARVAAKFGDYGRAT